MPLHENLLSLQQRPEADRLIPALTGISIPTLFKSNWWAVQDLLQSSSARTRTLKPELNSKSFTREGEQLETVVWIP